MPDQIMLILISSMRLTKYDPALIDGGDGIGLGKNVVGYKTTYNAAAYYYLIVYLHFLFT